MAVVLVSWLKDWEFWKSEARKGGGLDLQRLKTEKKLAFVDGLSKMCLGDFMTETKAGGHTQPTRSLAPGQALRSPVGRAPQSSLPVRGPPGRIDPRAPTVPATSPAVGTGAGSSANHPSARTSDQFFITSPELGEVQRTVENAIRQIQSAAPQRKVILVLDTPSFLLASNPQITPASLCAAMLHLHTLTSHMLVHVPADDALLSLSTLPQPLEVDAHNFLVKVAHMSSRILSCRVLDTGLAKDVSGVLRVTENKIGLDLALPSDDERNAEETQGRELLYLVKGDGSVKMFERGAGGDM